MVTDRDFLGQESDTAVGLSYLNNRYYDPSIGMFLSVDPLVATTGEAYMYGSGNPITLSDPSGLEPGCGPSAPAGSCAAAHGSVDTVLATKCLISAECSDEETVESIEKTSDGIGGLIFGVIDVAHQGNVDEADGNWNPKDLDAASQERNLRDILVALGASGVQLDVLVSLVKGVAERLIDANALYEQIDHEMSWFERNGSTFLRMAAFVAAVGSLFTGGLTGALYLGASVGLTMMATGTDIHYGRCEHIMDGSCGVDTVGMALTAVGVPIAAQGFRASREVRRVSTISTFVFNAVPGDPLRQVPEVSVYNTLGIERVG
jgi:RHS repeat-associated protein